MAKESLWKKLKEFRQNCREEFTHLIVTGYLSSLVLDKFSWSNDSMKEKVVLGGLLADITLDSEDFVLIRQAKLTSDIPEVLQNHPFDVATRIEKASSLIAQESIHIIKHHHERPNGKGFPAGLSHQSISKLTSVFIVCNYFVEQFLQIDFQEKIDSNTVQLILKRTMEKFHKGHFQKISESLFEIFDPTSESYISI